MRFLIGILFVVLPLLSYAADPGSMEEADGVFRVFLNDVSSSITAIQSAGSPSGDFVNALYLALVILRLGWVVAKWAFDSVEVEEVLYTIILILVVSSMMASYNYLTSAMHDWSTSFAGSIQQGMIGTSDPFYGPAYLNDLIQSMKVKESSIWDPAASFVGLVVLTISSQLLSIMSFFIVAWATWGYALAKLVGWMLVPLLLLPATAQWFSKWLGFFMGFLFYEIIGRTNTAMVLMLLTGFFNLPLATRPARPIVIDGEALSDFIGLLAMIFVSILALASTGKFAVSFGGAVDGLQGSMNGAAKKAAKYVAGKIF